MATVTSPHRQRAEAMRRAWQHSRGVALRGLGQAWAFFTSYPPLAQGIYYLLLGLWPLLGIGSYQAATEYVETPWIVHSAAVLLLVIGATLCLAAYRRQGTAEILTLAFGSGLGMAIVDLHLYYRGLSWLFVLDAILQVLLMAFWLYGWQRTRQAEAKVRAALTSPPQAIPVNPQA
jgi:hypothetical protein